MQIESNREVLRQIDSRDKKHSCIIIAWVLTSGGVDRLHANQVELSNTSDECIQFGCIGYMDETIMLLLHKTAVLNMICFLHSHPGFGG